MRAIVIEEFGSTDVLRVKEVPAPTLAPNQVRIDVKAAGMNFADIMTRLGHYAHAATLPYVGGTEVCGVVTELAPGVSRIKLGDRVAGVTHSGGFAEQVCIDHRDVIVIPDAMSFIEGAAVPVAYATSWAGMIGYGSLRQGERVLIKAAAGAVGVAAVQLAKNAGAEVWGAASPGKHAAIRAIGVDTALDYTHTGWDDDLPQFDLIMDAIGGDSFHRSYHLLRPGGRLVAYGAVSAFSGGVREVSEGQPDDFRVINGLSAENLIVDSRTLIGLDIRVLWDDRGTLQPWLLPLEPLMASKAIAPVVSAVVAFTDVASAHQMLTDRRNIGKVVLVP